MPTTASGAWRWNGTNATAPRARRARPPSCLGGQPDRDLLARYIRPALADRRAYVQVARELAELERRFPHDYDLGLARSAIVPKKRDALAAIAAGMTPELAAVFRWETGHAGAPPPAQIGREDEADRRLAIAFDNLPTPTSYADRLLADRDRRHRLLLPTGDTSTGTRLRLAQTWIDRHPQDWRGYYQLGRAHLYRGKAEPACAPYRAALALMTPSPGISPNPDADSRCAVENAEAIECKSFGTRLTSRAILWITFF